MRISKEKPGERSRPLWPSTAHVLINGSSVRHAIPWNECTRKCVSSQPDRGETCRRQSGTTRGYRCLSIVHSLSPIRRLQSSSAVDASHKTSSESHSHCTLVPAAKTASSLDQRARNRSRSNTRMSIELGGQAARSSDPRVYIVLTPRRKLVPYCRSGLKSYDR